MNHSRALNNGIYGLYKRALGLVYNFSSSFSELLEKDKSVNIHHRNLQTLTYEIFKVKNNMAPEILTEIFPKKESLRNAQHCRVEVLKLSCMAQKKIWDILPKGLKTLCLLHYSKRKFVNGPKELSTSFM